MAVYSVIFIMVRLNRLLDIFELDI